MGVKYDDWPIFLNNYSAIAILLYLPLFEDALTSHVTDLYPPGDLVLFDDLSRGFAEASRVLRLLSNEQLSSTSVKTLTHCNPSTPYLHIQIYL